MHRRRGHGGDQSAHAAFGPWASLPVQKRTEVFFTLASDAPREDGRDRHPRLTELGKNLDEARGEVVKIIEAIDIAVGAPMLMKGESLMNVSTGHDTVSYREPLGVFAGIAPFNFPAMIPSAGCCRSASPAATPSCSRPPTRPAHQPPAARLALRGRPAQGRRQHGDRREGAGRGAAQAPRRPRRQLRRHHAGRQAHLRHRRRARQARAGADAGQEPWPRAQGRLARARRPRHHQLHLRLRRHALHGAARVRRRERGRRRVRRTHEEVRPGARDRRRLRLPGPSSARSSARPTRQSVMGWIDKAVEEGAELVLDGRNVADRCRPSSRAATSSARPSSTT